MSLKGLAELAAVQCTLMPLRQFVDCSCGQFALLGLQFSWTAQASPFLLQLMRLMVTTMLLLLLLKVFKIRGLHPSGGMLRG